MTVGGGRREGRGGGVDSVWATFFGGGDTTGLPQHKLEASVYCTILGFHNLLSKKIKQNIFSALEQTLFSRSSLKCAYKTPPSQSVLAPKEGGRDLSFSDLVGETNYQIDLLRSGLVGIVVRSLKKSLFD